MADSAPHACRASAGGDKSGACLHGTAKQLSAPCLQGSLCCWDGRPIGRETIMPHSKILARHAALLLMCSRQHAQALLHSHLDMQRTELAACEVYHSSLTGGQVQWPILDVCRWLPDGRTAWALMGR